MCKYLELFKFVSGAICTSDTPLVLHIPALKTTDSDKHDGTVTTKAKRLTSFSLTLHVQILKFSFVFDVFKD